jgi:hypothetical protein
VKRIVVASRPDAIDLEAAIDRAARALRPENGR